MKFAATASRPVAERSAARVRLKPPQKAGTVTLPAGASADAALRLLVGAAFAHMRANLDGVLRSADPEYVHQMRVAVRRMRCAVRLFPRHARSGRPLRLNASLRRLSGLLGAVRDVEILQERIGGFRGVLDPADTDRVRESVALRMADGLEVLRAYLNSEAHARFVARLALWVAASPPKSADGEALAGLARRRLDDLHRRFVRAARKAAELNDARVHALRIDIKRSRYAAEFFRSLFNQKAVRAYVAALGEAQDQLGSLTDIKTCKALLRDLGLGDRIECALEAALGESASDLSCDELRPLLKACRQAGGYWKREKQRSDHV